MYHNVDPSVAMLAYAPWYDVRHLFKEIHAIRKINYSIVEQRQQALERINNILTTSVFDLDRRFAEGIYVCEALGDWGRKFQQLKTALSFKERDLRANRDKGDREVDGQAHSDAQQAFWNATTAILDQLVRADAVWHRRSFESFYRLDWH